MPARRSFWAAGLAIALGMTGVQPLAAQVAGELSASLRPLARPTAEEAQPTLAVLQVRPRARVQLAPGRPATRPQDVLPQPVSLFLRVGGTPDDALGARLSTRAVPQSAPLPVVDASPARATLWSFLPATPLRRSLIVTPIPVWERRTERDSAVSPEVAMLSRMMLAAMARATPLTAPPPLRPVVRPGTVVPVALPIGGTAPLRPVVRPYREPPPPPLLDPEVPLLVGQEAAGQVRPEFTVAAVPEAFRPPERPASIIAAVQAAAAEAAAVRASLQRGAVCGTIDIQGVVRGAVPGPGACGVENAVEVRSVAGVRLSTPAVIDCTTATALRDWVVNSATPRFSGTGGGLASIQIMGAYSCRSRNNMPGARLSEHAFGRAVDIGGFTLQNGNTISVLNGWNSGHGDTLRALHRAACNLFGTVLGPAANAAHRDHFHFDTARYRSGSYCR